MNTTNSLRNVLFESKHTACALLDTSGNVLESNQTFNSHLYDDAPKSAVSNSIRDFSFWNSDFKKLDKAWAEVMEVGKSAFTQELKVKAGLHSHYIEFSFTEEGILVSLTALPSEESLTGNNKERLASLIFHDLRAPVSNVAYLLSIFHKREVGEEELIEFVEALKKSNKQTLKVIDQVADLMSEEIRDRGELKLSLRGMIDRVLSQFKDEISSSNARIVVDIQDQHEWKIPQGAFQMILGQVISNSLKYTKQAQTPKIVITCLRENGDRIITVSDNGLGFDAEKNEQRLFGLFQTFHNHPEARGIGLFQVKNRLLSIGGEVSLESQKDIGTTVTLNFKQNELEEAPLHY